MNKKTKSLFLLLGLAVALLTGVTAAAAIGEAPASPRAPAALDLPWIHPPACEVAPIYSRDVILNVVCSDWGGDINQAFITDASYPVSYMVFYNGNEATIRVFRPKLLQDVVVEMMWCVGDRQGSMVEAKFTWP